MGKKLGELQVKNGGGDFQELKFLNLSKIVAPVKVRLLGDVHPAYRYWIPTKDGKMYPIIAKGFNPETESWDFIDQDPLFKLAVEGYKGIRKEFFYTINCIDRATGELKILPLKRTILNELIALANNPEYGEPTDPDNGYDITITKIKTGEKNWNIKYTVTPARNNSPLTPEERNLNLYNLPEIFRVPDNYEELIREKSNVLDEYEMDKDLEKVNDEEPDF